MEKTERIVWITGASSGIGKHLALAYARQGATVAISARRMEMLEELASEITAGGGKAQAFYCDVEIDESIRSCVQEIIAAFGRLDIAIANAGVGVTGFIEKLTAKDWERQLRINVTGLAMTVKYALPELRKTEGRLVLIGSVAAFIPNPFVGAYGASKAAVHNMGETLQVELKGTGVSCTTIHPGFVDSNIARIDNDGVFHPGRKDPRPAQFMWPTHKAAAVMLKAIEKRRKVYVFTGFGKVSVFIGRFFPGIARKMMAKQLENLKLP
ncbi:MAG TPA: SDR family NAD(P)-dependent oxidoreductase [Phnomibacter sp.]|nr:SDR family NAD(P)-dependent oxidoreductase [Phnomibacter sp.]